MRRALALLALGLAFPLFAADPAPTALTATRIGQTISVLAPSGLSNPLAHARASTSYGASDTSIVLETGGGVRFATPPFLAQWWNVTDYVWPDDDPYMEWVNVTAVDSDTWTVTRAQRGTFASSKDRIGRTYMFLVGSVQKLTGDVLSTLGTVTLLRNGTIGPLFSASWATATATPSLSLDLATQAANCLVAGPATGANAVPTCRAAVALDLGTTLAPTFSGVTISALAPTAGTMTATTTAAEKSASHRYDWTNAMVAALGASATGDITICTLPAKTRVKNAYVVIKTAAGTVTTLTVAVGRVSAGYIDYIVASDAKAAANTVYGAVVGDRGTNLTGYDLPSFTATTDVKAHFVATVATLDATTTSTGSVYLETELLP